MSEVRLDQNNQNIIQFHLVEDRSHHAGMETSLLRISANGCLVDEA